MNLNRRNLLKWTTPTITLLLAANAVPAMAGTGYIRPGIPMPKDQIKPNLNCRGNDISIIKKFNCRP